MRRRGFTLIELITVMAISGILLTLIIVPLFQGFNFMRQAQAYAEAQEKARQLSVRFAREIGEAVAVRDNSGSKGAITVIVPDPSGLLVPVTLRYAKIDIVPPAKGDPNRGPNGGYLVPYVKEDGTIAYREDPTATAPKGDVNLPLAPALTIVRYFVGLRQPFNSDDTPARYRNPYDGLLMSKTGDRDNLYVLYRAEVHTHVFIDTNNDGVPDTRKVNLALFQDDDNDGVVDDLDDPDFFTLVPGKDYDPTSNSYTTAGLKKAARIKRWLSQGFYSDPLNPGRYPNGKATILTEVSRYDAIQPVFDKRTRAVVYDNVEDLIEPGVLRDRPRLLPLVQFRPTRVSNDPAEGQVAIRLGEESENAAEIAPDVYTTKNPGWANAVVRVYPNGWDRADEAKDQYLVGRTDPRNGQAGIAPGFSIYLFDPDGTNEESLDGEEVFDSKVYGEGVSSGGTLKYPFTQAVEAADARSGWLSDPALRSDFVPFFTDPSTGKLIASFGIEEVGDPTLTPPANNPNNLPTAATGAAVSPQQAEAGQDPGYDTSPYASGAGYGVNRSFNRQWKEHPELRGNLQRFIDLRVTPQGDGTLSPLHPDPAIGFARAKIVPGSEEVFGPDQMPGPNYGLQIRYTRVSRTPGPNQYRINYVDQQEPDYIVAGFGGTPPATYDANNFLSAVIQPRFKAGYIELNSDPNVPLPISDLLVRYRFQFTRPNDTLVVDYDTRQVIGINLTILTYPQGAFVSSQTVSFKTTATARNYIR